MSLNYFTQFVQSVPVYFTVKGSIPAMLGMVYFSKLLHAFLSFSLLQKYDLVQASYRNTSISKSNSWAEKAVARAYNAHSNQWEAFIGFTAAVLLAIINNIETKELQSLVNSFLLVRLLYNITYIFAFNEPLSFIRSSIFTVGIMITFSIFSLSVGNTIF